MNCHASAGPAPAAPALTRLITAVRLLRRRLGLAGGAGVVDCPGHLGTCNCICCWQLVLVTSVEGRSWGTGGIQMRGVERSVWACCMMASSALLTVRTLAGRSAVELANMLLSRAS